MANSPDHDLQRRPLVDIDHTSPEYADNVQAITRDLRTRCPVAFSEQHGGYWLITDHDNCARALRDDAVFSSLHAAEEIDGVRYGGVNIPEAPYQNALIEMDPPEWNVFRRVLNPVFSPPRVEALRPHVAEFATQCVDNVIETGTIDFVLDLANPVPAMVTLLILGLPVEDWAKYAEPTHEVVYTRPGTLEFDKAVAGQQWMFQTLYQEIVDRRASPRDDVLTELVTTEVDGRTLTDEELLSMLNTVINGGVDTTTSLLANAIEHLDRDRETRRLLIDAPELVPSATEEFLRYFSPVQAFSRTVIQDTELGGQRLERGDRVLLCFASANRDEAQFPDPDSFVPDRFPNRHMAFGLGKHRCIGSTLARHQFAIVLDQVLARMPDYEIDRERTERYPSIGIVNGYIRMPAGFTPGPRSQ
ncbi:MAG TPA: cytochrome P450 [Acidimicrobiia bacterium]